MFTMFEKQKEIKTWPQFARHVRSQGCHLFKRLEDFPDSVLVSGCQRSGSTMLARIVTASEGMVQYSWGRDDELDAALVLSGYVPHSNEGRFCFQTTYMNECVNEYFEHGNRFKVIWMLRNPSSVVYSMVFNWSRFALNELFRACGESFLVSPYRERYDRFGLFGLNRLQRGCLSYSGKVSQVFTLREKLGSDNVLVLDYDELVLNKSQLLPKVYDFIGLDYKPEYEDAIQSSSLKKAQKFSNRQRKVVEELCMPVYEEAHKLVCR